MVTQSSVVEKVPANLTGVMSANIPTPTRTSVLFHSTDEPLLVFKVMHSTHALGNGIFPSPDVSGNPVGIR